MGDRSPIIRWVRSWALWRQRPLVVTWLLAVETTALVLVGWTAFVPGEVTVLDLVRFAVLLVAGATHMWLSRRQEETRRSRVGDSGPHIDTTSIWFVAAAVVLPLPLVWAVVGLLRWQRWFVARRPAYRYAYCTAVTPLAVLAARAIRDLASTGQPLLEPGIGWHASLVTLGALVAAALVYGLVQAAAIGIAVLLADPGARSTPTAVFGTRADNLVDALALALGIATTVLLLTAPATAVVMVAAAVVSSQQHTIRHLQSRVVTDPLTGLANRYAYDRALTTLDTPLDYQLALADERDQAVVERRDLCVVLVDVDDFKQVNDSYGHPAGDDALRAIADVLLTHTHPDDTVARIGGDEFAILVPQATLGTAQSAGERICAAVEALVIPTTDKRGDPVLLEHVSVSVGVSVRTTRRHQARRVVRAADRALYLSKASGRNHSTYTEDLP